MLDANKGKASQAELAAVRRRLAEIEAQVASAAAAVIRISFPSGKTAFPIGREDSRLLLAAARGAERISVSGYTDAGGWAPDAKAR